MALKRKLTSTEFDKLSDGIKAEYKKDGENYVLDVDGDEETGELRRANERNKIEAAQAKADAKKAADELAALKETGARNSGDVAALDASWKDKFKAQETAHKEANGKLTGMLDTQLRQNVAKELAGKISNAPSLLMPHILPRIKVDLTGDTPVTRILDANGQISALTIDDLQKELVANKDFAPIIVANRGSGSGGAGNKTPENNMSRFGGAGTGGSNEAPNLLKASPADLAAVITARKAAS